MKHNKLPWEYIKHIYNVSEGETFSGYTKKYNPPLKYISHRIISKGNKVIVETTHFLNSPSNKQTEENFSFIVQAVNKFGKDLGEY
jgi:hypothetical protein